MRNGIPAAFGDWRSHVDGRFRDLATLEDLVAETTDPKIFAALARALPRCDVELPEQAAQRVPALVLGDLVVRDSFAVSAHLVVTGSLQVDGLLMTASGSHLTVLGDVRAHAVCAEREFSVGGALHVSGMLVASSAPHAKQVRALISLDDGLTDAGQVAFDGRGDLDDLRCELSDVLVDVDYDDHARVRLEVDTLLERILDREPTVQWPGGAAGEQLKWLLSVLETPERVPDLVDAFVQRELKLDDAQLRVAKDWCLEQEGLSAAAQAYLGAPPAHASRRHV